METRKQSESRSRVEELIEALKDPAVLGAISTAFGPIIACLESAWSKKLDDLQGEVE